MQPWIVLLVSAKTRDAFLSIVPIVALLFYILLRHTLYLPFRADKLIARRIAHLKLRPTIEALEHTNVVICTLCRRYALIIQLLPRVCVFS